ncbi:MAG: hypothetical protein Q9202_002200 [Teloschistes flavicans]
MDRSPDHTNEKSFVGGGQPIPTHRLEEIATTACDVAFQFVDSYEHSRTETWNNNVIVRCTHLLILFRTQNSCSQNPILKSLIAESSTPTQSSQYKFAVTSTIIQHTTPPQIQPPPSDAADTNGGDQRASQVGRRGMHSASGAYWNTEKDGMWNWKYTKSEQKGFDVVLSIIWISIV